MSASEQARADAMTEIAERHGRNAAYWMEYAEDEWDVLQAYKRARFAARAAFRACPGLRGAA